MIPHGRYSKYSNDRCRCDACRAAWAAYQQDLRFRRSYHGEASGFEVPHGTTTGYEQYRCRCVACRKAEHDKYLLWKAREAAS